METLLFDIDGTLMSCGDQVRGIFGRALEATFGTTGAIDDYDFAGKTDDQIVRELMAAAGLDGPFVTAHLPEMKERYFALMSDTFAPEKVEVLPGAIELLRALRGHQGVLVGVQTGNWQGGAKVKLGSARLDRFFRFGGYGDGHNDRRAVPEAAVREGERISGKSLERTKTTVIGDTVLDVQAAKTWAMSAVGVTSGRATARELEAAGADLVVASLEELVDRVPL